MAHDSSAIVKTPEALGAATRARREALGLGLRQAAPLAGVGTRFLSEFERGKPSAEIGKILDALHAVGLDLAVVPGESRDEMTQSYSSLLETEFPYDWSNSRMDSGTFIRKVLRARRFNDVLKTVGHFGFDRVAREAAALEEPAPMRKAADMLARIYKGWLLARLPPHDAAA